LRVKRYIVTGTPGAGKTAILRQLELDGFGVVEEAATDAITLAQARGVMEPWTEPSFIDAIIHLQTMRLVRAEGRPDEIQFHDRCAICTLALAEYLGYSVCDALAREVERALRERLFEKRVFFVRGQGFVAPTAARRITAEEAARFERIHEETYRKSGFELIEIPPGRLEERVAAVKRHLHQQE
jgi:predicted ATPase